VNLVGHREVPADVLFDEPQSRARVHIGFAPPRLWITSGLPTILELASSITTSAFIGTYPLSSAANFLSPSRSNVCAGIGRTFVTSDSSAVQLPFKRIYLLDQSTSKRYIY
jgi:hypothetical protein